MLALAADIVLAREGVVLNPHYKTMGLYGSEYWTYSLPRAVGSEIAHKLTEECLPISAIQAEQYGMVQGIGPRCPDAFGLWLSQQAEGALTDDKYRAARTRKATLDIQEIERCREHELAQMQLDMVHNRQQFAEKCSNFVFKRKNCQSPQRLMAPWALTREAALSEKQVLSV